jgi:hypothetical protein
MSSDRRIWGCKEETGVINIQASVCCYWHNISHQGPCYIGTYTWNPSTLINLLSVGNGGKPCCVQALWNPGGHFVQGLEGQWGQIHAECVVYLQRHALNQIWAKSLEE